MREVACSRGDMRCIPLWDLCNWRYVDANEITMKKPYVWLTNKQTGKNSWRTDWARPAGKGLSLAIQWDAAGYFYKGKEILCPVTSHLFISNIVAHIKHIILWYLTYTIIYTYLPRLGNNLLHSPISIYIDSITFDDNSHTLDYILMN